MAKYIPERFGFCQRSGQKIARRLLVDDGFVPGLKVAPNWYEPPDDRDVPFEQKDEFKSHLTVPPIDGDAVVVRLPDCDLAGNSATYYPIGTAASVQSLLTGAQASLALYPSTVDFSTLTTLAGASEISAVAYPAGGYLVDHFVRDYSGVIVIELAGVTTAQPLDTPDVGGFLVHVNGSGVVAVAFRAPRTLAGRKLTIRFPIASAELGVAVYRS